MSVKKWIDTSAKNDCYSENVKFQKVFRVQQQQRRRLNFPRFFSLASKIFSLLLEAAEDVSGVEVARSKSATKIHSGTKKIQVYEICPNLFVAGLWCSLLALTSLQKTYTSCFSRLYWPAVKPKFPAKHRSKATLRQDSTQTYFGAPGAASIASDIYGALRRCLILATPGF